MTPQEFQQDLRQSLSDRRLSRTERQALSSIINDLQLQESQRQQFRQVAFELVKESIPDQSLRQLVDWLEDIVGVLDPGECSPMSHVAEAWFSPGATCRRRICSLFKEARERVDVCVFTVTDDEIADAIAQAVQRGISIRLLTDNDKALDTGSDVERLAGEGVQVRMDASAHHMHHKFAIFDGSLLLTGSYNWTRSAAENNEENFVVTDDRRLLKRFQKEFEELWGRFA